MLVIISGMCIGSYRTYEEWKLTAPAYVEREEYALRNLSRLSSPGMVIVKLRGNRTKNEIIVEQA